MVFGKSGSITQQTADGTLALVHLGTLCWSLLVFADHALALVHLAFTLITTCEFVEKMHEKPASCYFHRLVQIDCANRFKCACHTLYESYLFFEKKKKTTHVIQVEQILFLFTVRDTKKLLVTSEVPVEGQRERPEARVTNELGSKEMW